MEKGFTLIEILAYIAVFGIIIIALSSFIVWVSHSNMKVQAAKEVLDSSKEAMRAMLYEIREAISIYSPLTTSNQISLETLNYSQEGEDSSYVDFFLCGTQICIKKESQDSLPLTSDKIEVTSLTFSQIGDTGDIPSIQINLQANYKNPYDRPEYRASIELTSTASLRAY